MRPEKYFFGLSTWKLQVHVDMSREEAFLHCIAPMLTKRDLGIAWNEVFPDVPGSVSRKGFERSLESMFYLRNNFGNKSSVCFVKLLKILSFRTPPLFVSYPPTHTITSDPWPHASTFSISRTVNSQVTFFSSNIVLLPLTWHSRNPKIVGRFKK